MSLIERRWMAATTSRAFSDEAGVSMIAFFRKGTVTSSGSLGQQAVDAERKRSRHEASMHQCGEEM
jgi:hypothetical protein